MSLDEIVSKSRELFNKVLNISTILYINPGDMAGLCGVSQSCIYYTMLDMGIDTKNIKLLQLSPIFSKYSHACVGYTVEDEIYLIDLTFIQFMKGWDIPGMYFNKMGYIRLSPLTVKWLYRILNEIDLEGNMNYIDLFRNPPGEMLLSEPDHDRVEIIAYSPPNSL